MTKECTLLNIQEDISMSTIIINNNENFICKYDSADLPQFDLSETRDMEILLSQIGGTRVRGDEEAYGKLTQEFTNELNKLTESGEHGARMADDYYQRWQLFFDDPDHFASKYILQWLEDKMNRS
jgi:hypothetical protein